MRPFLTAAFAALLAALSTVPVVAGPTEAAFLARLAGSWSGNGRLTGADTGPISCRLQLASSAGRINYLGRCNVQDLGGQGFSGGITYNDATHHYEIRSAAGLVVGVRRGNSIVFTTKSQSMGGSYYSTMTLSPSTITINFTLIRSGEKTTSRVTFSR